jgi:uncharacterized protein YdhG (YjbR/CyaY superfamily)
MKSEKAASVDEYISAFPDTVQEKLEQIRSLIRSAAPKAVETISYGIPTFTLNGHYIIYFAGFKKHVSVYPAPRAHKDFKEALSAYEGGKGTVQFSLDEKLPVTLIRKIIRFRISENAKRAK